MVKEEGWLALDAIPDVVGDGTIIDAVGDEPGAIGVVPVEDVEFTALDARERLDVVGNRRVDDDQLRPVLQEGDQLHSARLSLEGDTGDVIRRVRHDDVLAAALQLDPHQAACVDTDRAQDQQAATGSVEGNGAARESVLGAEIEKYPPRAVRGVAHQQLHAAVRLRA